MFSHNEVVDEQCFDDLDECARQLPDLLMRGQGKEAGQ